MRALNHSLLPSFLSRPSIFLCKRASCDCLHCPVSTLGPGIIQPQENGVGAILFRVQLDGVFIDCRNAQEEDKASEKSAMSAKRKKS